MAGIPPGFTPSPGMWGQSPQGQFDFNAQPNNPWMATNWFPTLQDAEQAWFAANGGAAPQAPTPPANVGQVNSGAAFSAANPFQPYAPSTIQGQFPGGLPQLTAAQIMGIPQVSPQAIGGLPRAQAGQLANPFTVNASRVNPQQLGQPGSIIGQMGGARAYSPQAAESAIRAYMLPQFQQQQQGLTESLANAGIVGGTAAKAATDLSGQQQTVLMNDIQPYLMQLRQMQQAGTSQDIANQIMTGQSNQQANLTGQLANQSTGMQAQLANQQAQMQRDIQNEAFQLQAQGMNMQQALQVATQNAQQRYQAQVQNQGAYMTGAQYNANALTGAQQYNIGNLLSTAGQDAASYNQMAQYIMGLQQGGWQSQLGAAGNLAGAGLSAGSNAFQPIYQQPSQVNLGGIAQAFARPAAASNSPPAYGPNYGGPNPQSAFGYNYNPFQ